MVATGRVCGPRDPPLARPKTAHTKFSKPYVVVTGQPKTCWLSVNEHFYLLKAITAALGLAMPGCGLSGWAHWLQAEARTRKRTINGWMERCPA